MKEIELTLSDLKLGYPELIKEAEIAAYNRGLRDGETKARGALNREAREAAFLEKGHAPNYSPAGSDWEREGFFSKAGYDAFNKAKAKGLIHSKISERRI